MVQIELYNQNNFPERIFLCKRFYICVVNNLLIYLH